MSKQTYDLKKKVYDIIVKYSEARERRNKSKVVAGLIKKDFPVLNVDYKLLAEILERAETYDRYWRKILEENENLRGSDYKTKKRVVQRKQIELGYEPNYHKNIQTLKML